MLNWIRDLLSRIAGYPHINHVPTGMPLRARVRQDPRKVPDTPTMAMATPAAVGSAVGADCVSSAATGSTCAGGGGL